jgi:dihydrodipicolinate synthase/N-acetylneuraminate lyase
VKYAVPRKDPLDDRYLDELIAEIGRERIVSGFGEPPALPHVIDFGLASFTAGCVCIAPTLSTLFREAVQRGDRAEATRRLQPFLPLEALRERSNAIRVLHYAVSCSGVADMGPILPLLSLPAAGEHAEIRAAAKTLYAAEMAARLVPAG